ncbi:MAG: hypothetical protein JWR55_1498 [Aeromicrobium sp.]|jgi:hypothetical protein|nr:hypothetical protein [Aeromicrobium sp.]
MSTSTVAPEIVAFARDVREALADLPADEVDDLTEGLEADLAESLAEDLRRTLPDPVAYAAELRAAAGLPTRAPSRGLWGGLADAWRDDVARTKEAITRSPALASALAFFVPLRPVWWIARAWVAIWISAAAYGDEQGFAFEPVWIVPLLGAIVVSVQWGRGLWQFPRLRGLLVVGNILAGVAFLPVTLSAYGNVDDDYVRAEYVDEGSYDVDGLAMSGEPVTNIYAYDAAGNPLTGVQLFDIEGKPLVPNRDVDTTSIQQTPATLETGAKVFNVYPLALTQMIWDEFGELVPDPDVDPAKLAAYANGPFLRVPAVQAPAAVQPTEPVAPLNE